MGGKRKKFKSMRQEEARATDSPRALLGVGLMVAATAVLPVMDGIAKHLSSDYPLFQIVWARYFFHFLILCPVVLWRYGRQALLPPHPHLQVLRGGLLFVTTVLFFGAFSRIPLADALALIFIAPFVVTVLSALLLGESVGPHRWTAVVAGFIGACIIIRPGLNISFGALLGLGAGITFGLYLVTTRRLSGTVPPLVALAFTALLGAVAASFALPWVWVPLDATAWLLMLVIGLLAACGHFLMIRAFDFAPASVLAPYTYCEMVMAAIVGYFAFGDFPDAWTWLGIAVIVAAGLYVSYREHRLGKARLRQPPLSAD